MATVQESVLVSAPARRVWEAVVDFESRPRWSPRVKSASIEGGGPLRPGSRIRIQVDSQRMTPRVAQVQDKERLELEVRAPGFRGSHVYTLAAAESGTTLTLTGHYRGILGSLAGRFMAGSFRKDIREELETVRRAAESEG